MRREQVSAIINLLEPSDALQPLSFNYPADSMRGFLLCLSRSLGQGVPWLTICVAGVTGA